MERTKSVMRYTRGNLSPSLEFSWWTAFVLVVWVVALGPGLANARNHVKRNGEQATKPVRLATGDTLVVNLDGNPTTGYLWEMTAGRPILKQFGKPTFKPSRNLPGSGGKVTFRFVATAPGRTVLEMIYHRSFEKGVPPLKTFKLPVEVK